MGIRPQDRGFGLEMARPSAATQAQITQAPQTQTAPAYQIGDRPRLVLVSPAPAPAPILPSAPIEKISPSSVEVGAPIGGPSAPTDPAAAAANRPNSRRRAQALPPVADAPFPWPLVALLGAGGVFAAVLVVRKKRKKAG
jgi:hypothetical protein